MNTVLCIAIKFSGFTRPRLHPSQSNPRTSPLPPAAVAAP